MNPLYILKKINESNNMSNIILDHDPAILIKLSLAYLRESYELVFSYTLSFWHTKKIAKLSKMNYKCTSHGGKFLYTFEKIFKDPVSINDLIIHAPNREQLINHCMASISSLETGLRIAKLEDIKFGYLTNDSVHYIGSKTELSSMLNKLFSNEYHTITSKYHIETESSTIMEGIKSMIEGKIFRIVS